MKASLSGNTTETMNSLLAAGRRVLLAVILGLVGLYAVPAFAQSAARGLATNVIRIVKLEGTAEIALAGSTRWILTQTNQTLQPSDRLRTGPNSRVTLQWSDQTVVTFDALTEMEILQPDAPGSHFGINFIKGILSFFHRDKPGRIRVITRGALAGVEGTEFVLAVEPTNNTERTTLSVIDGKVRFSNEQGTLVLTDHQQAVAYIGQRPVPTPGFIANNLLQWCFYYPAVLDLRDLSLGPDEQAILADSLTAYHSGDLLTALARYPANRTPVTDAERIYRAALLLSVGRVDQTEAVLSKLSSGAPTDVHARLANALRQLIAAIKYESFPSTLDPRSSNLFSTELLAASYYEQSQAVRDISLRNALNLAKQAATNSPDFGFAWARVGELEFSFGYTDHALEALNKSLALSPRNAQAIALKGFLLAAQYKTDKAIKLFDEAIAVDPGLGNAWLGRGLCRIRRGDALGGREDLLVAAASEPQRAVLRSYLGKAYANENDDLRATKELRRAKELDPDDPTGWLYSALLKQQQNRINEAVEDLEKSQELNDNRSVYRSGLLLDQDRAVRSANLALLYADADLGDVSVREAGRAVSADYANYSAHVFLANSYEVERRANLSNLRFEAASLNEYLLANLLGPANGRLLAQPVTQLEYTQLFEQNRIGLIANTEYFSRGAWHNSSAQYGTLNGSSYSLEADYRSEPGERVNQDLELRQLEAKLKHDITPNDSVYLHVIDYRANGGDTAQHFDESEVSRTLRFDEEQTPTVLAGYHHIWSPQNHTLLLVGRLDDTLEFSDPSSAVLALDRFMGTVTALVPVTVRNTSSSRAEVYTAEAQQISVLGPHSLIAGARLQWSKQSVADEVADPNGDFLALLGTNNPVSVQRLDVWSSSAAIYAYDYVRLASTLQIVCGLNFTHQSIPVNVTTAPVSAQKDHQEQVNPKAAIIWSPSTNSTIRASYTKSLTGSGLGQSIRLEPTQVAGLLQTFRAPVPPSLVGGLDGVDLETAELLWEGRFRSTFLSLGGQWLSAKRNREQGLFLSDPNYDPPPTLGLIKETIRFREYAMDISAHELVGENLSFGVRYRLSYAQLKRSFPQYPGLASGGLDDNSDWRGWLNTLSLTALYRHHSGIFGRMEGTLFAQDRERDGVSLAGDNFWQVNATVGYRFPNQKAEVAVGVLNALDNDYRLDPINQHANQPRSRMFYARLLLNF